MMRMIVVTLTMSFPHGALQKIIVTLRSPLISVCDSHHRGPFRVAPPLPAAAVDNFLCCHAFDTEARTNPPRELGNGTFT